MIGEKELVGEDDILENQERQYSIFCESPQSEVYMIPGNVLNALMHSNQRFNYSVSKRMQFKMQSFGLRVW